MTYKIQPYTFKQAELYGVKIQISHNKKHKIDVIKNGYVIASIGATGYSDYPTYKLSHGLNYAEERRRLYKARHQHDRIVINSRGYWADVLLW
jgi:hypothetical protein